MNFATHSASIASLAALRGGAAAWWWAVGGGGWSCHWVVVGGGAGAATVLVLSQWWSARGPQSSLRRVSRPSLPAGGPTMPPKGPTSLISDVLDKADALATAESYHGAVKEAIRFIDLGT